MGALHRRQLVQLNLSRFPAAPVWAPVRPIVTVLSRARAILQAFVATARKRERGTAMLDNQRSAQTAGARVLNENQLIEEISWFETRLSEIGGGECAYEKGLARAYEEKLSGHRERLANLQRVDDRQGALAAAL